MAGEQRYHASQRVEGGNVEVVETEPGIFVAYWLEDPNTKPGDERTVPEDVADQGGDAALAWAVQEWNERRLGRRK